MSFAFISQPFGELSNTVLPACLPLPLRHRGEISVGTVVFTVLLSLADTHLFAPSPQIITRAFCADPSRVVNMLKFISLNTHISTYY